MHCCTAVSETRATEETLKEAENEKASKIFDEGGGDGENDEEEERDGVDGTTTDSRDFTQWSEEKRSNAVS